MRREILQLAVHRNAVLKAQLLPEFHADLVAALADLQRDDLARHVGADAPWRQSCQKRHYILRTTSVRFPHPIIE
jgi:hypothetical protein